MNIYDFDDTIYKGDTSAHIIWYTFKRYPFKVLKSIRKSFKIYRKYKKGQVGYERLKEELFSFLFEIDDLDKYIDEFIDAHMKNVKKWYLENQRENDLIISASYELWIKPFCEKLNIKNSMGTKTNVHGKVVGKNCKGEEKVSRYNKLYKGIVPENAYSDSKSDIPMLELAKKSYFVKGEKLILYKNKAC